MLCFKYNHWIIICTLTPQGNILLGEIWEFSDQWSNSVSYSRNKSCFLSSPFLLNTIMIISPNSQHNHLIQTSYPRLGFDQNLATTWGQYPSPDDFATWRMMRVPSKAMTEVWLTSTHSLTMNASSQVPRDQSSQCPTSGHTFLGRLFRSG